MEKRLEIRNLSINMCSFILETNLIVVIIVENLSLTGAIFLLTCSLTPEINTTRVELVENLSPRTAACHYNYIRSFILKINHIFVNLWEKSTLTKHIFTHSRVKPQRCQTCGKSFSRIDNLSVHILDHAVDEV